MRIEDEFRQYAPHWKLVWGVRLAILFPLVFVLLVVLESFVSMPGGVLVWFIFFYTVGIIAWFFPGLIGLHAFLDDSGFGQKKLDELASARRSIWFSVLREAVFLRRK